MPVKKYVNRGLFGVLSLVFLWVVLGFSLSRWSIKLTEYRLSSDQISVPLRIVEISDLHCRELGERLPALIAEQQPDLIFFVGDLVEETKEDLSPVLSLLGELSAIAPTYVSIGNHDAVYEEQYGIDLSSVFEETGAKVLDCTYEDVTIQGQPLRIGGIYGYCLPDNVVEARERDSAFLYEFQDTDRITLLMSHMPVCWIINGSLSFWDVDFVFSGHSHGGQVILPFIGGLYAPDQGWFPGECSGHFEESGNHLVVTTGLGGTTPVPRFWNRPEVVSVDILPLSLN